MMRLHVLVNGRPLCTAARVIDGSLHAQVNFSPPIAALISEAGVRRVGYPLDAEVIGDCELEVMAQPPAESGYEYLGWAKMSLSLGDEVTIRVLGPGDSDEPVTKRPYEGEGF
jgi:hypothetical protein